MVASKFNVFSSLPIVGEREDPPLVRVVTEMQRRALDFTVDAHQHRNLRLGAVELDLARLDRLGPFVGRRQFRQRRFAVAGQRLSGVSQSGAVLSRASC